jgi:hypothetical protein
MIHKPYLSRGRFFGFWVMTEVAGQAPATIRYSWRYVKPSRESFAEAIDDLDNS